MLWIDQNNALDLLVDKVADFKHRQSMGELINSGLTIVPGHIDPQLCDTVIADYHRWSSENKDYVERNKYEGKYEKRLVNFHLYSQAARQIACSEQILSFLDILFEAKAAPYSSLTFKYGSQQAAHKDTPHFFTQPENHFVGVWTALQDVSPEAGPLFYYPASHSLKVDRRKFAPSFAAGRSSTKALQDSLDKYKLCIEELSLALDKPQQLRLKKGDTVIWHPELIHGGLPSKRRELTRWSIVVHCAPETLQVHQHDKFFSHFNGEPLCQRYGFAEHELRKYALSGGTAFM